LSVVSFHVLVLFFSTIDEIFPCTPTRATYD
jgi:hypothetical protein